MKRELEVLSALVDGEPVDPAELECALAEPDAASVLVDFARLRRELAATERPDPSLSERIESARDGRGRRRTAGWLAGAAALVVLTFALPRWLGREPVPASTAVPEPDRVLRFEPGVDWNAG